VTTAFVISAIVASRFVSRILEWKERAFAYVAAPVERRGYWADAAALGDCRDA